MTNWLRHLRRVVLVGVAWGIGWAPVGVVTGFLLDPDDSMDEMWIAIGAYPGFLCGAVLSVAVAAKGGCRLDVVSVSRAGAVGAASGILVSALPSVPMLMGEPGTLRWWPAGALVLAAITLLSAVSATGSVVLVKWWRSRERSGAMVP